MGQMESDSGVSEWVKAHAELTELARRRAALDWEEGTAHSRAFRCGTHRQLGYASFSEYVERLFGYKRRVTEEKVRTAEALESLPETNRALRDGELGWSAARELTRVATAGTEENWLRAARGKTVRQVEKLVSGRKLGDRPGDPGRPELHRHVLHFEVNAETFATFREAVAHLRRKSDQPLDDDALLLVMAREILQGPSDEGRASYQLAITTCDHCGQGFQQGAGELLPVEPEIVEMAACDAQELGVVSGHALRGAPSRVAPGQAQHRRLTVQGLGVPSRRRNHLRKRARCGSNRRRGEGVLGARWTGGFSEKQARNALARVSVNDVEARTCEQVLRAALRCLTEKPGRAA